LKDKEGTTTMQHYYKTDEMEKNKAGEGYSPTEGSWVTGERIIFGKMRIPAGTRAEPHSHPNEQFVIVLSGAARVDIEGDVTTITEGDIAYIPANAVHSAEIVGEEDYVFVTAKDTSWGIEGIKA
jgi:quercetin dioxygenase-like cupin family protein